MERIAGGGAPHPPFLHGPSHCNIFYQVLTYLLFFLRGATTMQVLLVALQYLQ